MFQRRQNGLINFYRNWAAYVEGFGDLYEEFWLRLDKIHRLTHHSKTHTLRIEMTTKAKNEELDLVANYTTFHVGAGTDSVRYTLEVGGYAGTAGDRMTLHNGKKFSTRDQDDTLSNGNCAKAYQGAWWYYQRSCYYSSLNGDYTDYFRWGGTALTTSEMKTREN